MREKDFEKKVKAFLVDQGCWILKTWSNGIQREGIPDLLVCCDGYFLGIELKAPNGKPSELQLWNIDQIKKAGGIAMVLYPDDFEDFKRLIGALKYRKELIYKMIQKGHKT
jgi:hypothetical protein